MFLLWKDVRAPAVMHLRRFALIPKQGGAEYATAFVWALDSFALIPKQGGAAAKIKGFQLCLDSKTGGSRIFAT